MAPATRLHLRRRGSAGADRGEVRRTRRGLVGSQVDLRRSQGRVRTRSNSGRRWLAFPYAVFKKFGEDPSGNLAVLITYYAFFSIFPLLLALSSVLGFVLHGHPSWASKIENARDVANFPLIKGPPPKHGSVIVVVVGVAARALQRPRRREGGTARLGHGLLRAEGDQPGFLSRRTCGRCGSSLVGGLGLILTTIVSSTARRAAGAIGLHVGGGAHRCSASPVTLLLNTCCSPWCSAGSRSATVSDSRRAARRGDLGGRARRSCRPSRRRSSPTSCRASTRRTARSAPSSSCCRGSTCSRRSCCSPRRSTSSSRTDCGRARSTSRSQMDRAARNGLGLDGADLVGLRALLALRHLELDPLALFE